MEISDLLFMIFSGVFGLVVGSFLNVCIYRIPKKVFFAEKHSYCPKCNAPLKWFDMVPVISYIVLGGKCRNCKEKISPRYPIVEALTALLWVLTALVFKPSVNWMNWINAIVLDVMFAALIVMTFIDLDTKEIPNGIVLLIMVLSIPLFFTMPEILWWHRLVGAVAISVPLYIIALITGGGIGGGDIKLFFALGLVLGLWRTLIAGLLAIIGGGLVGAILLISKKAKKGTEMPLGPFIALGTVFAVLLGNQMIAFFAQIFGL